MVEYRILNLSETRHVRAQSVNTVFLAAALPFLATSAVHADVLCAGSDAQGQCTPPGMWRSSMLRLVPGTSSG